MAKNKDRKKKERERRVAQKKLAASLKRAKTAKETESTFPKSNKTFTPGTLQKTTHVATNKKSPFTQRRSGG